MGIAVTRVCWPTLAGIIAVFCLLSGCTGQGQKFRVQNLAKSDVDLVADLHREHTLALLEQLTIKLYRRNPAQLLLVPGQSIASRWEQIRQASFAELDHAELGGARSTDAMHLAFDANFRGDRIFALMAGLSGMLGESYAYKREFFWLDTLDQQKLYNSARNIEILVWLLRTRLDAAQQPLILTDSMDLEAVNLSFERLFGKLIAHQDVLAEIVAGRTQRTINTVAQGIASMTFIPL